MSTPAGTSSSNTTQNESTQANSRTPVTTTGQETELETSQGRTTISDVVVSKIAGLAAREVSGVYDFGGGTSRAFGAVRERIPGARASTSQGVAVEVGERQAAVDLTVVVEYGVAIVELSRAIRRNVIGSLEQMTGLEVVEVNINVVDLHLPATEESDPSQQSARVA